MKETKSNLFHLLISRISSVRSSVAILTGGIGINRLWAYLRWRERAHVHLDANKLIRENALWREVSELKAQVRALEVKLVADAKLRDWLVGELSNCRLALLLTMGEVNAECVSQSKPARYDLREEANLLRARVPPS